MRKKVIVFTANTSWYLYNFRKNTILELIFQGYRVIAVAPSDEYSSRLCDFGCDYIDIRIDQKGTNPLKDFKTFLCFLRIYHLYTVDLVFNFTSKNNIYSTLAARINNIIVVNNISGLGILFIEDNLTSKLIKLLYRISQGVAAKVFFQNQEDMDFFLRNKLTSKDKAVLIPGSGVDLNRFSNIAAPDDGIVRFLLVSRMLFHKGVKYYVDAARALRKKYGDTVQCYALGFLEENNSSAINRNQMQRWVDEGIITYLGVSDNVEYEIAKVDCIVLPSFYREGIPKSLLEAGAMGKPIITTDNVGCRETVKDSVNGFICTPKSVKSLVEKMDKMFRLPHSERLNMGIQSRNICERKFDERIVIQKYLEAASEYLN